MTRHLVVVCPDWPVVASGSPVDRPVAVVAANRVVACSAAARAEGVETGLRRRQAEARCPGLVVVAHDPCRDARAFEPVVAAVEAFTPAVEILLPGTCATATRGPSRYFGGDHALVTAVTAAVDDVLAGLGECRVGVADGRLAAGLAAEVLAQDPTVVPPGKSRSFLAPFPVSALPGDGDLPELLVRLGIRTLGDLASLPMPAVLARFGTEGATACRRARGLDDRPLAARTPPPDLAVTAELDPPADRVDTIAFVARSLAEELHQLLAGRGLAATRVLVEAETDHGDTLSRRWHHDGGLTAAAMAERVRWQLDGWLAGRPPPAARLPAARDLGDDPAGGGLTLLRLTPEEVGPDEGRQQGFWGGDRAAAERAVRALARVQGVLGPASVVTATLAGGRGPAEQVRLIPWGDGPPAVTGVNPIPPWPGRIPSPAPATVHPVPPMAEVVDAGGRPVTVTGRATASAPPAWLTLPGGHPTEVRAWAGPWPVDERWWDPAAHRRRARAQMVTADGAAHLLVVEGGRWSVEAAYD